MEIEFSHVTYYDNNATNYKKLIDVSFIIESNKITGIVSDYDNGIIDLVSLNKRPSIGTIRLQDNVIKKSNKIINKKELSKKIGIIKYYTRNAFFTKTVKEEMLLTLNNYGVKNIKEKINWALKIVGLNNNILERNPNNLSATEKNKLAFALALSYNPEVLIFDNFELGLSYKEKENFKRLLRVLKLKYHKTIILISNNVDFLKNIVDKYLVINNGSCVFDGLSCYNSDIYDYTDMPLLIDFINYVRSEGHDIDRYIDIKELIKGIYRDIT